MKIQGAGVREVNHKLAWRLPARQFAQITSEYLGADTFLRLVENPVLS
jgi:hypothetical protein